MYIAPLALLSTIVAAQIAPPESVIRTSTRLVQVNVIVHDKHGPVPDLTKEDFVLTDRSKPQTISAFSVDSMRGTPALAQPLPPNTFSNRHDRHSITPSVTVVLLDTLNTRFEDQARAKRQFLQFLASANPEDHIAVYILGKSLRVLCDFTGNPEQLQRTLAGYRGGLTGGFRNGDPMPADTGNADLDALIEHANELAAGSTDMGRIQTTLSALVSIVNHAAEIPGRKNLVWLTGDVPFSLGAAAKIFNGANVAVYPIDARGLVGLPAGLTAGARSPRTSGASRKIPSFGPEGIATMQQIAEGTGGHAFYNRNDLSNAIRIALEDSTITYSLGFYPHAGSLDGKFHDLNVQVKRAGLNVRYRKGYYAFKDTPASERETRSNLQTAMWSPLESSTIPLRVVVERVNQPKPNCFKVRCSVDIQGLQLSQNGDIREGSIEVYILQQDPTGNTLDGSHDTYRLSLTKEKYASYLEFGMGLSGIVEPKEGLATLRVLIADQGNGAVGSLIIPVSQVK